MRDLKNEYEEHLREREKGIEMQREIYSRELHLIAEEAAELRKEADELAAQIEQNQSYLENASKAAMHTTSAFKVPQYRETSEKNTPFYMVRLASSICLLAEATCAKGT